MGTNNSKSFSHDYQQRFASIDIETLLSRDHVLSLIPSENGDGQNSLQYAVIDNNLELLQAMLRHRDNDLLIAHVDSFGCNAIQSAILNGNYDSLKLLLDSMRNADVKSDAIISSDDSGNNSLQLAAAVQSSDGEQIVLLLLDHLEPSLIGDAIMNKNSNGQTAITLAASHLSTAMILQQRISDLEFEEIVDSVLLGIADPDMLISSVIRMQDNRFLDAISSRLRSDLKTWLENNNDFALSSAQLKILSPVAGRFVIPSVQTLAKKYLIVCYNLHERDGGEEEAQTVRSAFESIGYTVIMLEWASFADMRSRLVEETNEIKNCCSVLVTTFMSHGFSGNLMGTEGSYGEISDIIDETRTAIPIHIPLVTIVQACQEIPRSRIEREIGEPSSYLINASQDIGDINGAVSYVEDMNEYGEGTNDIILHEEGMNDFFPNQQTLSDAAPVPVDEMSHILLRPENCALMVATVHGRKAFRGHFTSALSTELSNADEVRDVFDTFTRASDKMTQHENEYLRLQRPEFRSTLRWKLIL